MLLRFWVERLGVPLVAGHPFSFFEPPVDSWIIIVAVLLGLPLFEHQLPPKYGCSLAQGKLKAAGGPLVPVKVI